MRICIIAALVLAACSTHLSEDQQSYLNAVRAQSLAFTLEGDKSARGWSLAKLYLERHSPLPLQRETQAVMETQYPRPGQRAIFGYIVERQQSGKQTQFTVSCYTPDGTYTDKANLNAQILAYYMVSGKVQEDFIEKYRF